ncbi:alpha/beta hydrolase [Curtobacterium caseinilyticum]|uniref:Alpha/beta hydrolase-fold protein n=1 Tax=Curtobacterium caseinilyticum TaxID=3055137 RepID=A0ABT7TSM2_9MICO|nr:alpha/beta hydrolase-fold protein [Curtobacterium caseinilyticum]MDM7892324.1 alpha/beta hydrolase-fold protein [Curtobacterium caseinilyticum]
MTTLPLLSAHVLLPLYALTLLTAVTVVAATRRSWRWVAVAVVVGALLGTLLSWFVGDVLDVLDIPPTWVDRIWTGVVCALLGVAVVGFVRGRRPARAVAVLLVPLALVSGGLAVNRDAGLFPTIADALGESHVPPLRLPTDAHPGPRPTDAVSWRPPRDLPAHGRYGSVRIPGAVSHFHARPALVWLPPAALVEHAPELPVVVMLSGQGPGAAPANIIEAGRMVARLDAIARRHRGLAPIVVMPDQLAEATNNPMCVDGPLGNSATYLTRDVPAWVHAHLHAATGGTDWAISGFSQGGTCALQLGAGRPDRFGSWIDVSGQIGPVLRDRGETVSRGFRGDDAAYEAAQPLRVLAERAPYRDSAAFVAAGADDSRYGPVVPRVVAAARAAGVAVTERVVEDGGHDWHTAGVALAEGVVWFMHRTHLAR